MENEGRENEGRKMKIVIQLWQTLKSLRKDFLELGKFKFKNDSHFELFQTFLNRDFDKRCSRFFRNAENGKICDCGSRLDFENSRNCAKCEGFGLTINK